MQHNTDNYTVGKGILTIAKFVNGAPVTYVDMGNCTVLDVEPTTERLPHLSSRSGFKFKDKNPMIMKEYSVSFTLDEPAKENLELFMMGTTTSNVVNIFQGSNDEFALRFTSDNPIGVNYVWDLWRATISPNGSSSLIGEEWMQMEYLAEGLSDLVNHAGNEYGTVTYATTTTTTTTTTVP